MLKVLDNDRGDNETTADEDAAPTLDELARTGARKMLMTALAVEVAQYVDAHQEARDEQGRRLVVRNGRARARKVPSVSDAWVRLQAGQPTRPDAARDNDPAYPAPESIERTVGYCSTG